jgi:succinylglutamate desuccinylase
VAFAGNLKSLKRGVRFIDRDLNRLWNKSSLFALQAQDPSQDDAEEAEARELLSCFKKELACAKGKVLIMDLHTSSADGPPFSCMGDTIPNRKLAFALPVPVILGLEEAIDGALLDWFYEQGHVAIAVEGGKHESKETVDNLEAMVWISLVASGNLHERDVPRLGDFKRLLEREVRGIPHIVEIRHREIIHPGEHFHMIPGFKTFDRVQKETPLAEKDGKVLRADEDGYVLLPLYQGQGEDGFFLGRRVPRFWLLVASLLRRLRASKLLPLLPGVRRHPHKKDRFLVDPKIARWGTVQVFHLLGYRRRRPEGDQLVFSRRPQW